MILSKGLKFTPYKTVSCNDYLDCIDTFSNTLRRFSAPYRYDLPRHPYLPNNSLKEVTPTVNSTINKYIETTKQTLLNQDPLIRHKENLTHMEREN